MKAVILAGGRGTRLLPYTTVLPKPLMPVGDRPILDIVMRQLRRDGFTEITLAVSYLAELLMAYFGDGARFGLSIRYSREEKPLGTAGPLGLVDGLTEPFLLMNGDILTDLDFGAMVEAHRKENRLATVAVCRRSTTVDQGVVQFDAASRLTDYAEKPTTRFWVSMGAYVFDPRVLGYIRAGDRLDVPDLLKALVTEGETVHCHLHEGTWLDIGCREDYDRAVEQLDRLRPGLLPGLGLAE